MKILSAAILGLLFYIDVTGQNNSIKAMIDSLSYTPFLYSNTLDCKADLYWRIVAKGKEALPYLIENLSNTEPTNIKFHCKKKRLNAGEVSYFAINEIGYFPLMLTTNMQFDVFRLDTTGQSCWSFYDFFFYDPNKVIYQEKIRKWYQDKQPKYSAKKIENKDLTECQKKYGIKTYFQFIE